MNEALENLLKNPRVWRAGNPASTEALQGYPSGYPKLDRHLPGGGWPRHALTEILIEHHGTGELRLLMPALARLCRAAKKAGSNVEQAGWIAWIAPPFQPYPPALTEWNLDLSRLLIVHPERGAETFWAAEQALASGNCAAVLLWPEKIGVEPPSLSTAAPPGKPRRKRRFDPHSFRRLQLAAEKGRSWAIAFRPLQAAAENSAAALRLRLVKGDRGTDVVILKSRGGRQCAVQNVIHDEDRCGDRVNVDKA